jgi:hypothetical protein
MRAVERLARDYPAVSLFKATSFESFCELVSNVTNWHCVIIDAETGFGRECCTFINKSCGWVPYVVLTTPWDESSFSCLNASSEDDVAWKSLCSSLHGEAGSTLDEIRPVAVFAANNLKGLPIAIHRWCLIKKLFNFYPEGFVKEAVKALFEHNPISVEDWSLLVNVKQRRFQREMKRVSHLSPKQTIALYHAYCIAFAAQGAYLSHPSAQVVHAYIIDKRPKARVMEYVLTHRSTLLSASPA